MLKQIGPRSHQPFGVVELRRYVVHPGMRNLLATLFERKFIDSQIECGMTPIGHFNDLADPSTFVWIRGFEDMKSRLTALTAFYRQSRVWKENREAANATIVDSDNVLLLRPACEGSGFDLEGLDRAARYPDAARPGVVSAMIFLLHSPADEEILIFFESKILKKLRRHGHRIAYFVSEQSRNDFPALPVREDFAFVVIGVCPTAADAAAWSFMLDFDVFGTMRSRISSVELLKLEPLPRSLLR